MAVRLKPEVLLVHEDLPGIDGYRVAELVTAATSEVAVVMLVARESEAILRRAMASGVRAVASADASGQTLSDILSSVSEIRHVREEAEYPLVTDPQRMPRSIAVTGARGGVGKTTVAVNLAVTFAKRHPGQVVLVDFPGQFGDAALALDITPHDTIADLAAFDELDPELIETHLATHQASSLRLLSSPDVLREVEYSMGRLDVPFLASLIGLLRRAYRYVFFDVPPLHWPMSQYVFTRCQQILVVSNHFDLATIRDTKALLEVTAASGMADENRVKLIANRATWRGEYKLDDLQATAGRKVYFQLPDDFENAAGALNKGVPVVLDQPNCALARAFNTLADHLLAEL